MNYIMALFLLVSTSCLEQEKSSTSKKRNDAYSPGAPIRYTADYYAKEQIPFSLDSKEIFEQAPSDWSGYSFSIQNAPAGITVDSSGVITGKAQRNGLYSDIKVVAQKLMQTYETKLFSIAVNGDPLRKHAWHLSNTGQSAFASWGGIEGEDINVYPVYERGVTGKNARIAVSDTGVETMHDDLYENMLEGEHKNYTLDAPYYGKPVASDAHGTAVSSLIGAKGWNNEGSMGVAPDAKMAGFQFLMAPGDAKVLIDQASGNFDIFNYSYGDYQFYDVLSDSLYIDHLRSQVKNARAGLGAFYVKSAGNEYTRACFPHNANAPWENESPYIIVTGAVDAFGEKSTYSNAGSNLWISAPGGDSGRSFPAIISADLPTCFKGYSKATSNPVNPFEYGHSLNSKCNYTSTMNGTSSSAPIVSGVIALMLEQNPSLSWRDVKHILASTAKKVDPNTDAWPYKEHPSKHLSSCANYNLEGHVYEQGWAQNAAGFTFNNYYGFGMVDADAAVRMADNPSVNPRGDWLPMPQMIETNPYFNDEVYDSGNVNKVIPDHDPAGVNDTITVNANPNIPVYDSFVVESVQIKLRVDHAYSGEVGVELTSPAGTKSVLLNINNSFLVPKCDDDGNNCRFDQNLNIVLASHAFYGEPALGEWTLKVIDGMENDEGKLVNWKLNLLGHNP